MTSYPNRPNCQPLAGAMRLLLACALAFISPPAQATLLTLTNLTSSGLPDTNYIKSIAADTNAPTLANGTVTTIGSPIRWTPDSNGVVRIYQTIGNYLIYGHTLERLQHLSDSDSYF